MKKIWKKRLSEKPKMTACLLAAGIVFTSLFSYLPSRAFVDEDYTPPDGAALVQVKDMTIAPGVREQEIVTLQNYKRVNNYVVEVDLADYPSAGIVVGNWHDTTKYNLAYLSRQVYYAKQNGKKVVAGFNGDFFNTSTGEPQGCFIKDGIVVKDLGDGRNFFGMKKDGTAVIGDDALYKSVREDLTQAIGAGDFLVVDGEAVDFSAYGKDGFYGTQHPRTAVGLKEDGTVVFSVADGRQGGYSIGYTMGELAAFMKSMDCVTAVNLDGGSSSTYVARAAGTDKVTVRNSPSNGSERKVGTSLLITSDSNSDGSFASAVIEPSNKIYTPDSSVTFSAVGLDSSNEPTDLPEKVEWSLLDHSLGSIDQQGVFTSNGKEGTVEIQLLHQGKAVGTARIEIQKPDSLDFATNEISLGFDAVSDLGLLATYQNRDVILKEGDLKWEVPEELGEMEGNQLHTSAENSSSGTIRVTAAGTEVSASINVQVGQLPVILYDFEDGVGDWEASVVGRGEVTSIESAAYEDGEPVRFGNKSLKLNYDLTNALTQTTLGAYAGPATSKEIPGMPTGIGAWVYASAEAQGYWLRFCYYDKNGTLQFGNFTEEGVGINWTGWKYCEVDLTEKQGPFMTKERQMIRLMSVGSGVTGPMTKGEVYVDNVRVVYGVSSDDMYPPIVKEISADGQVFTDAKVSFEAAFEDDQSDKYASGMDYDKINVYVDGINYKDAEGIYALDPSGNTVYVNELELPDGVHRIDVVIRDLFGNETKKSAYFTVRTGQGTTIHLGPEEGSRPMLGETYQLELTSNQASDIASLSAVIQIGKGFPVEAVEFHENFNASYEYDDKKGTIKLQLARKDGAAPDNQILGVITVRIPDTVKQGDLFAYQVDSSEIQYVSSPLTGSFMIEPQSIEIEAAWRLSVEENMVGRKLTLKVTDQEENPVSQAQVLMKGENGENILFGTTDEKGLASSLVPVRSAYEFTAFAQKDKKLSFQLRSQTLQPLGIGMPTGIRANAVENASTSKNITWMSNPFTTNEKAVMQIAPQADYEKRGEAAFEEVMGNYTDHSYTGALETSQNGIIRMNSVIASDLNEGVRYCYRVGDGERWSKISAFTQLPADADTNFFILGDTQTENTLNLEEVLKAISDSGIKYHFGIHTGDVVDDSGKYAQLDTVSKVFSGSGVADLDIIQTLGNHEYMGDTKGTAAKLYYNTPQNGPKENKGGAYSVEYGNVYFASLGYCTDKDTIQKELEWLKEDVSKTTKKWKVVLTHQPVYYSNPDGNQDTYKEMLPEVMDELGIDFVFSGHDHAYARTYPLYNGETDPMGTTYFICGSTGEKYYTAIRDEHFEVFDDTKDSCYLSVSVTEDTFQVKALRTAGEVIDTYTKVKKDPVLENCEITFDQYKKGANHKDGQMSLTLEGNLVRGIKVEGQELILDQDYTVQGGLLTLKEVFLTGLKPGTYCGSIQFCPGRDLPFTVKVIDTTPAAPPIDESESGSESERESETDTKQPHGAQKVSAKSISVLTQGFSSKKLYLQKGRKARLKAVMKPAGTTDKVTWTSSRRKVAAVNSKGAVKAKGTGKTIITARTTSGKKKRIAIYVVKKAVKSKKITFPAQKTMRVKQTIRFLPKAKVSKTTALLSWRSSNKKIAGVDAYGYVTAKKKGTCYITIKTSDKESVRCKVKVK